jgi:hypothetical protein
VEIFKKIVIIKEKLQHEKDVSSQLKYAKEINDLELEAIQHDFALLKL